MSLLRCEFCEIELHGRDVYFDGRDSYCCHCDNPLDDGTRRRKRRSSGGGNHVIPLPKDVTMDHQTQADGRGTLILKVPWRIQRPQDGLRLFGWIVVAAVALGAIQLGTTKLVGFALGALVLGLMLAVRLVNHTTIVVGPETIRVSHGPIPWLSRVLKPESLEQLYVNRRPIAQKVFDYSVHALLDDGRDVVFLRALKHPAVAFYLEHCIEEHLQIEDKTVRGEFLQAPPPDPSESGPYLDPEANAALLDREQS